MHHLSSYPGIGKLIAKALTSAFSLFILATNSVSDEMAPSKDLMDFPAKM